MATSWVTKSDLKQDFVTPSIREFWLLKYSHYSPFPNLWSGFTCGSIVLDLAWESEARAVGAG